MNSNAVATLNSAPQLRAVSDGEFTAEKVALIKKTIMPQASDLELDLFVNYCRTIALDPLAKQVYAIRQKNGTWQFFASIDGLRVTAQRTGEYLGQTAPYWCSMDATWRDVWLADGPPAAAKVGVFRRGNTEPTWGVATFRSYGTGKGGNWTSMPDVMLAKCAEASALRKAFPAELSGVYVREEFADADATPAAPKRQPPPRIDVVESEGDIVDIDVDYETGEILALTPIQPEQIREITTLKRGLGWDSQKIRDFSLNRVGKADSGQLTVPEADYLIEQLRMEQDDMLATPAGGDR